MARVIGLAVRTARRAAMREIESAQVDAGGGIRADIPVSRDRGLTLLAQEQWADVQRELGVELPWYTRRANVLVEGLVLGDLIGKRLRLGEVELIVVHETEPCDEMDEQHPGLKAALKPERRGGVHGRVIVGGPLRLGDAIVVLADTGVEFRDAAAHS